jgi:hypothetical protein
LQELNAEKLTLEQTIATNQAQLDNLRARRLLPRRPDERDSITRQPHAPGGQRSDSESDAACFSEFSGGFLRDILSTQRYSFHASDLCWDDRAGIIFVPAVYNNPTMPEFSPTPLG